MDDVRIAVLDSYDNVLAFMDNTAPKCLHYYADELHTYLKGSAYTYKFTCSARHEDSQHLAEGNKIAFVYRDKDYYLNIMRVVKNEYEVQVEAYGLLFELLNEQKEAYAAPQAMSFEEYMAVIDYEHTITIGINEVSDKKITHEWTGSETILGRIYSLANVFDAEVEFVVKLQRNYALKEIVMNVYEEHSDTAQGIGARRNDITLRYGVDVSGITKTADISGLYTAIRPVGRDGLTIASVDKTEYDANGNIEYESPEDNRNIYAVQARDRYPSNLLAAETERYIAKVWSYDTDNVEMLYGQALAELKKICVPQVSYDVQGYFDTDIGDTVEIADDEYNPPLYLEARVSEQIRSFTDPTRNKTIFSNFRELQSEIDPDLLARVEELAEKNKPYACYIQSDNGIVFKNGLGSTTLTAHVNSGTTDVSADMTYQWTKDGTSVGSGRSLTIDAAGIETKAVFAYTAFNANGEPIGRCEVTVSNVKDGTDGKDGDPGVGIESFTHYYLATSAGSGVTTETSGWTTTPQNMTPDKKYLWNYDVTHLSDGSDKTSEPCIIGIYGQTGPAGTGINSITEYYAVSASNTTEPTSWVTSPVPDLTPQNKYLWNYEHFVYTDGSTYDTEKRVIGVYGDTGEAGRGVSGSETTYQVSDSGTVVPTGTWTENIPDVPAGKYLWTRTVTTYTDGTSSTSYSVSRQPEDGTNGTDGKDGKTLYGECEFTLAGTANKLAFLNEMAISDDDLYVGITVSIHFAYGNTAASPLLTLGACNSYPIMTNGTNSAYWTAGANVLFTWDGTYWQVASQPVYASVATIGNSAGRNVRIDEDSVDVRNGTDVLASFGENTVIGDVTKSHVSIDDEGFEVGYGDKVVARIGRDAIHAELASIDTMSTSGNGGEVMYNGAKVYSRIGDDANLSYIPEPITFLEGGKVNIPYAQRNGHDYVDETQIGGHISDHMESHLNGYLADCLKDNDIRRGVSANYQVTGQANVSISVTFPRAFNTGVTPIVVATPMPAVSGQQASFEVAIKSVSRTGFQAALTNRGNSTYSVKLAWMAIGPDD